MLSFAAIIATEYNAEQNKPRIDTKQLSNDYITTNILFRPNIGKIQTIKLNTWTSILILNKRNNNDNNNYNN